MNRRAMTCAGAIVLLGVSATTLPSAAQQRVPPPTAIAHAKLMTQLPCYLRNQVVRISGSGYAPGAPYSVILDRAVIGNSTVAADGSISGTLSSGSLAHGVHEMRHRVQVTDGNNIGRVGFSTVAFDAEFTPSSGNPRTLLVKYTAFGIGLGHSGPTAVYLHYLDPRGHLQDTVQLGMTSGPCGNLTRTVVRHLFPFHHVVAGKWALQFDTRRDYGPANQPRIVRTVMVGG